MMVQIGHPVSFSKTRCTNLFWSRRWRVDGVDDAREYARVEHGVCNLDHITNGPDCWDACVADLGCGAWRVDCWRCDLQRLPSTKCSTIGTEWRTNASGQFESTPKGGYPIEKAACSAAARDVVSARGKIEQGPADEAAVWAGCSDAGPKTCARGPRPSARASCTTSAADAFHLVP